MPPLYRHGNRVSLSRPGPSAPLALSPVHRSPEKDMWEGRGQRPHRSGWGGCKACLLVREGACDPTKKSIRPLGPGEHPRRKSVLVPSGPKVEEKAPRQWAHATEEVTGHHPTHIVTVSIS